MKPDNYFSYIREDIIEIASESGSIESVLDVGCGYGYTGFRLKEIGAQKVDGIEFGTKGIVIIAGPCSVEDRSQLLESARHQLIAHAVTHHGDPNQIDSAEYGRENQLAFVILFLTTLAVSRATIISSFAGITKTFTRLESADISPSPI